MVDANSLIEGHCKFRDGRKWKSRWAVITKLSPVADCLQLQVYRDEKERARNGHTKASLSLQDFLALETGFTLDKESHTLAIICQDLCVVLSFDNRERLIQWSVRIANNLGEGQHFLVQLASAPTKSKLTPGPVKLHVTDKKFCLTSGIPPKLSGIWELSHLRRYGVVDGRIVFEGGSRCGKGEGVHVLVPDPPQLNLIIDAFDMSSKGQLARAPSRRFGSVVDSPRKSMTSRLSEMRSLIQPGESTANLSLAPSTNLTIISSTCTSTTISAMSMQAPRESRSAEALCTACGEINGTPNYSQQTQQQSSLWMSSESSSSRCDLDNCDNISLAICPAEENIIQRAPLSPARNNPLGSGQQPLQIAKPLPSAMERCLSCMSKLGQHGQDVLTPSWTMDLNSLNNSSGVGNCAGNNGNVVTNQTVALPQGSIGSGNSDRLSISSHGSSSGTTAEFYNGNYDTPRSILVAEMRRNGNGRCNTPPGMFQNGSVGGGGQMIQGGQSNCHFPSAGGVGSQVGQGGCSSPFRVPRCPSNQNPAQNCVGNCHCQNTTQGIRHGPPGVNNSHIYYNSVAEQKSLKAPTINLHPTAGHSGPYENYDFPRCIPQQPQNPMNSYPSYSGESIGSVGSGGSCVNGTNSIDWAKKLPMDRSSVATTASTSLTIGSGSDQLSEFYDTPRKHNCPCCAGSSGCPCCSHGQQNNHSMHHTTHQVHGHIHHPSQAIQNPQHSHYQNPSCIMRRGDPMENYDVPPSNNPHLLSHSTSNPNQMQIQTLATSISINGEGKMPLVAGSRPNPNAIYAQVDKSKKTSRPVPQLQQPHQQQQQQPLYANNCDTHHNPIYENRNAQISAQPTYINLVDNCSNNPNPKTGKLPAPDPTPIQQNHHQSHTRLPSNASIHHAAHVHSNYVNLDFAESLQLYENAHEIATTVNNVSSVDSSKEIPLTNTTKVLVHSEPEVKSVKKIETVLENEYENMRPNESDQKMESIKIQNETSHEETKEIIVIEEDNGKTSSVTSRSNSLSVEETSGNGSGSSEGTRRGSQESSSEDAAVGLPLRRSSSVPCKGIGHANRGSASSSDSGVSGDGGLFFDDSSPLNDIGSLCLHESLPRKSTHRASPNGKNTSTTSTPRAQESTEEVVETESQSLVEMEGVQLTTESPPPDPLLANRHYETIDEVEAKKSSENSVIISNPVNPTVEAVKKFADPVQKRNLVSDANSTSNSDMSDYIETLSSCSSGSGDTLTSVLANGPGPGPVSNLSISASPKKSTSMKPRSGKEYFKIDRSMFKND